MICDEDFALVAYISLADELTPIPPPEPGREPKLEDFDPKWLEAAQWFAGKRDLPWPPPDVDTAMDLLKGVGNGRLG